MDLDALPLDQQRAFCEAVWKLASLTPSGKVVTYGQLAGYIPCPPGVRAETYRSFRARWAGSAMAVCPAEVPWQRVINAQGMISPRRGAESQRKLLEAEGVTFDAQERLERTAGGMAGGKQPAPAGSADLVLIKSSYPCRVGGCREQT
jgi:methylated-DNA-protein-cysteine methyltransferase-like protein